MRRSGTIWAGSNFPIVMSGFMARPDAYPMFTFTCEYRTTDGRRWSSDLRARTWDDAISQAEYLGLVVSGVLVRRGTGDWREPVEYNGLRCPPCPVALRQHPSVMQ